MSSPLVSMVIACHGAAEDLPGVLACLARQREYVVRTSPRLGTPVWRYAVGICELPREIIVCSDGPYSGARLPDGVRLIECPQTGGVGHGTRGAGIAAASGEWLVLTNQDNLFVHGWLHRLSEAVAPDVGLLYWDCVNSLWRWGTQGGSRLAIGGVDLSCVAVRTPIARQVGFTGTYYEADWDYISQCAGRVGEVGLRTVHIGEILCVHN